MWFKIIPILYLLCLRIHSLCHLKLSCDVETEDHFFFFTTKLMINALSKKCRLLREFFTAIHVKKVGKCVWINKQLTTRFGVTTLFYSRRCSVTSVLHVVEEKCINSVRLWKNSLMCKDCFNKLGFLGIVCCILCDE